LRHRQKDKFWHLLFSHWLTQCHANGCVHVARQRLRTVNVRNKFFQYIIQRKVLKCDVACSAKK